MAEVSGDRIEVAPPLTSPAPAQDPNHLTVPSGGHGKRKNPPKPPKKKKSALVRYLTLKEPSREAFEKMREAHLRQAAKNGSRPGTGTIGVSQRKLPPTVPPVNSKWDGLPQGWSARQQSRSESTFAELRSKFGTKSVHPRRSRSSGDSQAPPASSASSSLPVPGH